MEGEADEFDDYAKRDHRLTLREANARVISFASLMMLVGVVQKDAKVILQTGCVASGGHFLSSWYMDLLDISMAKMERDQRRKMGVIENGDEKLRNPLDVAIASNILFAVVAIQLVAAACISKPGIRLLFLIEVVSVMLVVYERARAKLGRTPVVKSCAWVLVGGFIDMGVTFLLTNLISSDGLGPI